MSTQYRDVATLISKGVSVLLIDDQAIIGEAVRRMLAPDTDITLTYCQNPIQALKTAEEVRPTVILLDLVMPDMDGMTLARFFKKHPALRDIPLIVLSTKEEPTTKAKAFEVGASDYLVKLPDRIELVARIRHHSQGYINQIQRDAAYKALADQLARAAEYVISLLPKVMDEGPIRTSWRYQPSAMLGGDCFGHHFLPDGRFAVYLLDVCDHGVGPALLAVSAINVIASQSLAGADYGDPASVLSALNEAFKMEKQNNLYFTIWYGVFDPPTRELRYASAGHPPAILTAPDGSHAELKTPNLMVGIMDGLVFKTDAAILPAGASLYVLSDGVYEITRKEGGMWTYEECREFLLHPPDPARCELEQIYEHDMAMQGGDILEDDFSLLKITFD